MPPLLELKQVGRSFGRRRVLQDVSFQVHPGQLVGIAGENGAGKSTLLRVIVGLLAPDEGEVQLRARLGYCPQEPLVFDGLTVRENFRYFAAAYRIADWQPAAARLLAELDFERHAGALVAEVSGGTRQKLNLALALLHRPDLLLLDEPYAGFDWETYLRFWELAARLRDAGRSLVVVSHLLHERARFDTLLTVAAGSLS